MPVIRGQSFLISRGKVKAPNVEEKTGSTQREKLNFRVLPVFYFNSKEDEMRLLFACPLCGKRIEIKKSRKGRPYATCLECQCWIFVNSESGIEKLKAKAQREG
jgi:hypothetical protein